MHCAAEACSSTFSSLRALQLHTLASHPLLLLHRCPVPTCNTAFCTLEHLILHFSSTHASIVDSFFDSQLCSLRPTPSIYTDFVLPFSPFYQSSPPWPPLTILSSPVEILSYVVIDHDYSLLTTSDNCVHLVSWVKGIVYVSTVLSGYELSPNPQTYSKLIKSEYDFDNKLLFVFFQNGRVLLLNPKSLSVIESLPIFVEGSKTIQSAQIVSPSLSVFKKGDQSNSENLLSNFSKCWLFVDGISVILCAFQFRKSFTCLFEHLVNFEHFLLVNFSTKAGSLVKSFISNDHFLILVHNFGLFIFDLQSNFTNYFNFLSPPLNYGVSCAFLHGDLLLLGLDNGSVITFSINFDCLSESKITSSNQITPNISIIDITFVPNSNSAFLVAVEDGHLFVVSFPDFPPNSTFISALFHIRGFSEYSEFSSCKLISNEFVSKFNPCVLIVINNSKMFLLTLPTPFYPRNGEYSGSGEFLDKFLPEATWANPAVFPPNVDIESSIPRTASIKSRRLKSISQKQSQLLLAPVSTSVPGNRKKRSNFLILNDVIKGEAVKNLVKNESKSLKKSSSSSQSKSTFPMSFTSGLDIPDHSSVQSRHFRPFSDANAKKYYSKNLDKHTVYSEKSTVVTSSFPKHFSNFLLSDKLSQDHKLEVPTPNRKRKLIGTISPPKFEKIFEKIDRVDSDPHQLIIFGRLVQPDYQLMKILQKNFPSMNITDVLRGQSRKLSSRLYSWFDPQSKSRQLSRSKSRQERLKIDDENEIIDLYTAKTPTRNYSTTPYTITNYLVENLSGNESQSNRDASPSDFSSPSPEYFDQNFSKTVDCSDKPHSKLGQRVSFDYENFIQNNEESDSIHSRPHSQNFVENFDRVSTAFSSSSFRPSSKASVLSSDSNFSHNFSPIISRNSQRFSRNSSLTSLKKSRSNFNSTSSLMNLLKELPKPSTPEPFINHVRVLKIPSRSSQRPSSSMDDAFYAISQVLADLEVVDQSIKFDGELENIDLSRPIISKSRSLPCLKTERAHIETRCQSARQSNVDDYVVLAHVIEDFNLLCSIHFPPKILGEFEQDMDFFGPIISQSYSQSPSPVGSQVSISSRALSLCSFDSNPIHVPTDQELCLNSDVIYAVEKLNQEQDQPISELQSLFDDFDHEFEERVEEEITQFDCISPGVSECEEESRDFSSDLQSNLIDSRSEFSELLTHSELDSELQSFSDREELNHDSDDVILSDKDSLPDDLLSSPSVLSLISTTSSSSLSSSSSSSSSLLSSPMSIKSVDSEIYDEKFSEDEISEEVLSESSEDEIFVPKFDVFTDFIKPLRRTKSQFFSANSEFTHEISIKSAPPSPNFHTKFAFIEPLSPVNDGNYWWNLVNLFDYSSEEEINEVDNQSNHDVISDLSTSRHSPAVSPSPEDQSIIPAPPTLPTFAYLQSPSRQLNSTEKRKLIRERNEKMWSKKMNNLINSYNWDDDVIRPKISSETELKIPKISFVDPTATIKSRQKSVDFTPRLQSSRSLSSARSTISSTSNVGFDPIIDLIASHAGKDYHLLRKFHS
ncbi:hypothetical protein RCL1_006913 [Eukaryota sp. TZLM3-RCL]